MALGIDIYRYQTVTDPAAVKRAGVRFAWVKLTDGTGPAIVRGDKQVNQMKAVAIPVGGYHYAQLGDPVRQADVFLAEVRRLGATGVPPALDLEAPFVPDANARSFGIAFCRRVAAKWFRPAVYMSGSFAASLRPDQWGIPGLVIWIASYGVNDGTRHALTGGYTGRLDCHQYTSSGHVAGISGQVDLNWSLTDFYSGSPTPKDEDMELTDTVDWDKVNDAGPTKLGWSILNTRDNAKVARENSAAAVGLLRTLADDLDETEATILGALSTAGGASVDVDVLADKLADKLGPDIGAELVDALGRALRTSTTPTE
jgi:GH25 family lysozyme M1 (1,4-beta-N-acetylmuramidase)